MNPVFRISIFTAISMLLICFISWAKGNEKVFVYDERVMVNPSELNEKIIPSFEPESFDYYRKYTISQTKKPSSIPCLFVSKYDTVSVSIFEKYRN